MAYWWIDRALPGIVSSLIMATVMAASHVLLRRHVTRTAQRQDEHLDKALSGRESEPQGGA